MSATNRRNQNRIDGSTSAMIVALGLSVAALASVWVAVTAGSKINGVNPNLGSDPFAIFFDLLRGRVTWPTSATWILVATIAVLVLLAVLIGIAIARSPSRRSNVDGAATYMGKGRDLRALSVTGARQTARRLGAGDWLGVPIGITVAGRQKLYGSPEDMHVDIWGPRIHPEHVLRTLFTDLGINTAP